MKRALLEGPGILKVVQDDAPEPGAGEVLVRVELDSGAVLLQ